MVHRLKVIALNIQKFLEKNNGNKPVAKFDILLWLYDLQKYLPNDIDSFKPLKEFFQARKELIEKVKARVSAYEESSTQPVVCGALREFNYSSNPGSIELAAKLNIILSGVTKEGRVVAFRTGRSNKRYFINPSLLKNILMVVNSAGGYFPNELKKYLNAMSQYIVQSYAKAGDEGLNQSERNTLTKVKNVFLWLEHSFAFLQSRNLQGPLKDEVAMGIGIFEKTNAYVEKLRCLAVYRNACRQQVINHAQLEQARKMQRAPQANGGAGAGAGVFDSTSTVVRVPSGGKRCRADEVEARALEKRSCLPDSTSAIVDAIPATTVASMPASEVDAIPTAVQIGWFSPSAVEQRVVAPSSDQPTELEAVAAEGLAYLSSC
jgi:hypothetical protein